MQSKVQRAICLVLNKKKKKVRYKLSQRMASLLSEKLKYRKKSPPKMLKRSRKLLRSGRPTTSPSISFSMSSVDLKFLKNQSCKHTKCTLISSKLPTRGSDITMRIWQRMLSMALLNKIFCLNHSSKSNQSLYLAIWTRKSLKDFS